MDIQSKQNQFQSNSQQNKLRMNLRNRRLQKVQLDIQNSFPTQQLQNYKDANLKQQIIFWVNQQYDPKNLNQYLQQVNSNNTYEIHQGLIALRKILCSGKEYLQNVIDSGIVPRIIELAGEENYLQITLEACWIIANLSIFNDSQNEFMLDKGLLSVLEKQLSQKYFVILDQVLWCIGNISTNSATQIKLILNTSIPSKIFSIFSELNQNETQNEIRDCIIWISKNILNQVEKKDLKLVQMFIQIVIEQFVLTQNKDLKEQCLSALGKCFVDKNIQIFRNQDFIVNLYQDLFQEMQNEGEDSNYLYLLLSTIGGLTSLNDPFFNQQFQYNGLIDLLAKAIHCEKKKNLLAIIWILQNFALEQDNKLYIQRILVAEGLIQKIFQLTENFEEEVRHESLWYICALSQSHQQSVLINVLQYDFFSKINSIFKQNNSQNINIILEILIQLFITAQQNNNIEILKKHIYDKGIHLILDQLQKHHADVTYFRTLLIIENFLIN